MRFGEKSGSGITVPGPKTWSSRPKIFRRPNPAKSVPNLDEKIASGNLLELRRWLKTRIHRLGRRKTAPQLIQDLTGAPLSAEPFMDYLETKFSEIYDL
ncbi:MAG: hypothetical protein ACE5D1_03580 [Fidelibacterota bacterium]